MTHVCVCVCVYACVCLCVNMFVYALEYNAFYLLPEYNLNACFLFTVFNAQSMLSYSPPQLWAFNSFPSWPTGVFNSTFFLHSPIGYIHILLGNTYTACAQAINHVRNAIASFLQLPNYNYQFMYRSCWQRTIKPFSLPCTAPSIILCTYT